MATKTEQTSALAGVAMEGGDLASLLKKEFKPRSDEAKSAVESAVQTLAQQALGQTKLIGSDVINSIDPDFDGGMLVATGATWAILMNRLCPAASAARRARRSARVRSRARGRRVWGSRC